jgi:hypothetical protein
MSNFWLAALWLPLAILAVNVVVRRILGLPQSAVPDLILCFVVFDGVVAIQPHEFDRLVGLTFMKGSLTGFYVIFLVANMAIWFLVLTGWEERLADYYRSNQTVLTMDGMKIVFSAGLLATAVMFLSVAPFAYGG